MKQIGGNKIFQILHVQICNETKYELVTYKHVHFHIGPHLKHFAQLMV